MKHKSTALSPIRLSVELIPRSTWGMNVRAIVSQDTWDGLRWNFGALRDRPRWLKFEFQAGEHEQRGVCDICRDEGERLHLHEQWHWFDSIGVQRLRGLQPLCERCHLAKHFGRANQLGKRDIAIEQMRLLNDWTKTQVMDHVLDAERKCLLRSSQKWHVHFDWLGTFLSVSKIHLEWLRQPNGWVGDRLEAIEWAREVLKSDALILDSETTGLAANPRAEIIELAILSMKGKVLFDQRFKPKYRIPKRTTDIHGISDHDVARCPGFSALHPRIVELICSQRLISYKSAFDSALIEQTCELHKMEVPDCRWECAMWAYRSFAEVGRFKPLPDASHTALGDARACLKLIKMMARA